MLPERNSNPFLVPLSLTDSTDPEQFFLFRKHAAKPPSVQGAAVGQPDEVLHDDERRRRRPGAQDRLGYAEEESGHDVCCDVSFSFCARRSVAGDIGRRAAPTSSIVFFSCVCGYMFGCSNVVEFCDHGGICCVREGISDWFEFLARGSGLLGDTV